MDLRPGVVTLRSESFMYTVFATLPLFAELQRRGWFPFWLAIVLGLAAVVAVGVLYVKEAGRLGVVPRLAMACVRMTIVLTVAFLLLRPVWVAEDKGSKPRSIGVLIDVSQSMDSKDPRPLAADQWRTAIAFGLVDPDKGLPNDSLITSLREKIPERPKRIEVARAALTNPKIDFFSKLYRSAGPLDVFTFGIQRTGHSGINTDWLKDLQATEPRTALVEAAYELLNRVDADAPAALVLVTDGRENASPKSLDDLARECARRKIPVHVYGVGSSAYGQLRVRDVIVPDTLFVDDYVTVPVRYTVKGVSQGKVDVVLTYGGREVAAKRDIPVREGDDLREVLSFVPTKEDSEAKKQELAVTVTVTSTAGITTETLTDGITKPAQVVNKKLKVLVIDSLPRYDFKYLQRALLRDRRVEAKFYLTEGDKPAMRSGPPWLIDFSRELNGTLNLDRDEFRKILFDFDLVILGDVPGKYFSHEQQQVIKEFVTEGGGLIHIAGRWHAPAAWADDPATPKLDKNPIGEMLPIEFDSVRFPIQDIGSPAGFVPVLGPAASRSPIVTLEDDAAENAELWGKPGNQNGNSEKQLKPMYWFYPVKKTKPAADVFLTHPTARTADGKPMPLLVGHFFGKGYVLYVGFDDTWRWRFNTQETVFGRFWSQAVYIAGIPRTVGTKLTQLSLDTTDPTVGRSGQVYARVFNENFKLLTADEIDATLEKVDADPNDKDRLTTIKLRKLPGQDGEYVAPLPFNQVGRFKLIVDAKNKTPATLDYRVNLPPDHEQAAGSLDETAMRKLCETTGGTFFREEDLHKLPAAVTPQSSPYSRREEVLLWNRWPLFLLIGLLTVEWFMRKYNGLS